MILETYCTYTKIYANRNIIIESFKKSKGCTKNNFLLDIVDRLVLLLEQNVTEQLSTLRKISENTNFSEMRVTCTSSFPKGLLQKCKLHALVSSIYSYKYPQFVEKKTVL